MTKLYVLVSLAAFSLLSPILELVVTGRVAPFSKFELTYTLLSISLIYWWYHLDKKQRQFRAGPIQNIGVLALALIALPVYFIRSRGWKRGGVAIILAGSFFALTVFLAWIGETIGVALIS